MERPDDLKIGDKFRIVNRLTDYPAATLAILGQDDRSNTPGFHIYESQDSCKPILGNYYIHFDDLEPLDDTRPVSAGDIILSCKLSTSEKRALLRALRPEEIAKLFTDEKIVEEDKS